MSGAVSAAVEEGSFFGGIHGLASGKKGNPAKVSGGALSILMESAKLRPSLATLKEYSAGRLNVMTSLGCTLRRFVVTVKEGIRFDGGDLRTSLSSQTSPLDWRGSLSKKISS